VAETTTLKVAWESSDGKSRFYQGDCFDLFEAIPDNSIDCVWTDPPYFLSNGGMTCVAGRMVKVDKGKWDESRGVEEDHKFNRAWLSQCYRVLKPAGTIWVSGTHHVYFSVGMAMMQIGYRILNDIVWQKTNPPPNLGRRCFTHSTEMLIWATKAKKGSRHRYTFHYDEMCRENNGKQMQTVWTFPAAGHDEKRLGKHPTQKPLALVKRCLRASTNPKDVILDPFSGSGTTGVASLQLDRHFFGCELESRYVDIAVKRLAKVVRDKAHQLF